MSQAVSSSPSASSSNKSPAPGAGLEGVVAAKSEICFIDGVGGRLVYRGYEIGDLVENASFEEVAHLLWDGKLPNKTELTRLRRDIAANMALPSHVSKVLEALPKETQPMDALRTACSTSAASITRVRVSFGFLPLSM